MQHDSLQNALHLFARMSGWSVNQVSQRTGFVAAGRKHAVQMIQTRHFKMKHGLNILSDVHHIHCCLYFRLTVQVSLPCVLAAVHTNRHLSLMSGWSLSCSTTGLCSTISETLPVVMTVCSSALWMTTCRQEATIDIAPHLLRCIGCSSQEPDGPQLTCKRY